MSCNAPMDTQICTNYADVERRLFSEELMSVDHRIATCNYWLDTARGSGDVMAFSRLELLLSTLRLHRDCCRNLLVRFVPHLGWNIR